MHHCTTGPAKRRSETKAYPGKRLSSDIKSWDKIISVVALSLIEQSQGVSSGDSGFLLYGTTNVVKFYF